MLILLKHFHIFFMVNAQVQHMYASSVTAAVAYNYICADCLGTFGYKDSDLLFVKSYLEMCVLPA